MDNDNDKTGAPYSVGYGRPPVKTRYPKGTSGNPSGRPKKDASFAELTHDKLNKKLPVTLDGRRMRLTLRELVVDQTSRAALKGDRQARKLILDADAARRAEIAAAAQSTAYEMALDEEALNDYLARLADAAPKEVR